MTTAEKGVLVRTGMHEDLMGESFMKMPATPEAADLGKSLVVVTLEEIGVSESLAAGVFLRKSATVHSGAQRRRGATILIPAAAAA